MNRGNGAAATTITVLTVVGALVLFCLFFTAFLLVPFFVFIAAGVALVIAERNSKIKSEEPAAPADTGAEA